MGRVEVVLDDELERRLRLKALTKFGGRKGALVSAVSEAVSEYVSRDSINNLIATARDRKAGQGTRANAMRALQESGDVGLEALTRIAADPEMDEKGREVAALWAREATYENSLRLHDSASRHPSVVRHEYGPEGSKTIEERTYGHPRRRAKDSNPPA